jgi:hypothetical protein
MFSVWFIFEPSFEPLLGVITSITALISFGARDNIRNDWILVGILAVVAIVGILTVRWVNHPVELVIVGIFNDGLQAQEGDEYVVIRNEDVRKIQLEGWTLHDSQMHHVFTFPRYEMQPGDECRIYTNEDHSDWCGFNFRNGGSGVWNNSGDMATLRNDEGIIIDSSIDLIYESDGEVVISPTEEEHVPTEIIEENVLATGGITITTVFYNGEKGAAEPDEYVEIRNDEEEAIFLEKWTLSDESNHVYDFPSVMIEAGQTCRIYTNEEYTDWCGFNYKNKSPIWGNKGDCATLRDGEGKIVSRYCYP